MPSIITRSAPVLPGHGQGKRIGVPTINIDPASMPSDVEHGIYACRVMFDESTYDGALHYGPRPVFGDTTVSCEIHVLDHVIDTPPARLDLLIFEKIRDVRNFESPEAMTEEIDRDIRKIRAILSVS